MKIKIDENMTFSLDDEAFFSWLMLEMLMFVDSRSRKANFQILEERIGLLKPRRVKVTVNSACDLLAVGPLVKIDPMTYFTFFFPALNAEATLNLVIYENSIDIHVHGKGQSLTRAGTYESIIDDINLIYKNCWEGANIPALYSSTCGDLMRVIKKKDLKFIKTQDYNWPLFCNLMAKLVTCIAVAEPYRCLLMHPVSMMDLYLGKMKRRELAPITDFKGSSSALSNIQQHFEAERRDENDVPPLSMEGKELLATMGKIVGTWVETVLQESKKKGAYQAIIKEVEEKRRRPMELLQEMVSQKILRHLDESMKCSFTSINEMVHREYDYEWK